jgi:hypothetical protein
MVYAKRPIDPSLYVIRDGALKLKPVEHASVTVSGDVAVLHLPEGAEPRTPDRSNQVRLRGVEQKVCIYHPTKRIPPVRIPKKNASR